MFSGEAGFPDQVHPHGHQGLQVLLGNVKNIFVTDIGERLKCDNFWQSLISLEYTLYNILLQNYEKLFAGQEICSDELSLFVKKDLELLELVGSTSFHPLGEAVGWRPPLPGYH